MERPVFGELVVAAVPVVAEGSAAGGSGAGSVEATGEEDGSWAATVAGAPLPATGAGWRLFTSTTPPATARSAAPPIATSVALRCRGRLSITRFVDALSDPDCARTRGGGF
jgi:hypothetical protein